ncbi:MAG: serine/threonine-protein kinase [Hyphomicrobium sp.]
MTNLIALPSGTELVGDYRIERVLGAGGFGITYLADEIALARLVTIKEYFPSDFAARAGGIEAAPRSQDCAGDYRWGLDRFIEEAQTLAKFDHTNIVRVYRYFRSNNTGYMVLHFEEGESLKSWLKSRGRAPRQKELDAILAPMLDALELIHKSDFLHRDIAPDNIIIRKAGDPVLIDFGSARGEIAAHSKTVSALVKPGYSPYEQYAETSKRQGPWTDIYALGATLYHAVTGKRPPDAPSRMIKDEIVPAQEAAISSYRPGFLKAIDRALKLNVESRPQSIADWRNDLLVADAPKTGWLTRSLEKKKKKEKEAPSEADEVIVAEPPANRPAPAAAKLAHVPPDVPGPKGGMLDFFDELRRKPAPRGAPVARAAASSALAETVKLEEPAPTPKTKKVAPPKSPGPKSPGPKSPVPKSPWLKKPALNKAEPNKAEPKKSAAPKKAARKPRALFEPRRQTRPRPVKGTRRRWVPLAFKFLIGVGVASTAVAMQDRFSSVGTPGVALPPGQQTQARPPASGVALIAEFDAHQGRVAGIDYSDDGRWIVTAGKDATIKIWDAAQHSLIRTIELDDGGATALALYGKRALTGHANGKVVLWGLERGEKLATVQRNEANIWAVAFLGDPDRFAVASHDWRVTLWDVRQQSAPLSVLEGHDNAVQALAVAPGRQLLASGSADKTVRLWDLKSLKRKRTYRGQRDFITALAFSQDGKRLAGSALDGRIRLWSTLSRRTLRLLRGHKGKVEDLAFSPSGTLLASAGEDGTVRLWNLNRRNSSHTLTGHIGGATALAFAPNGQQLASAGANGKVRLWAMPPAKIAKD